MCRDTKRNETKGGEKRELLAVGMRVQPEWRRHAFRLPVARHRDNRARRPARAARKIELLVTRSIGAIRENISLNHTLVPAAAALHL